ncbi:translocation/assembly module TamB domain-containing protein [uncultured Mailhella sp.]|uniref:translocation/assembly module TamB domain-containing protein n=1 Tax=uncultured Mailhella sp. TaxID=1981031 RepID=UPI0025DBBCFF|nr:translocation/assembly module TamB domain-containing protein [uncultured Mailhella sp.]
MNEKEHDDLVKKNEASSEPSKHEEKKAGKRKRLLRVAVWGFFGTLGLMAATCAGSLIFLRSSTGEAWLARTVNEALSELPSGLGAHIETFHGPLPSRIMLSGITLNDDRGIWLEAEAAELRMDWSTLPGTLTIAELSLENPHLLRVPQTKPAAVEEPASVPLSSRQIAHEMKEFFRTWPGWLPSFNLERLNIRRASLAESITGVPLTATFEGQASLNHGGAEVSFTLHRDDASCLPISATSTLSPELEVSLQADGSDLGLAALLPEGAGDDAQASFHLTVKGNPSLTRTDLSLALRESGTEKNIFSASALGEFSLFDISGEAPSGAVSLQLESGPASERLWALAGQKNGRLKALFRAQALGGDHARSWLSANVELADMTWKDATIAALFGSDCTLNGEGTLSMNSSGGVHAAISALTLQASGLRAFLAGSTTLPEGQPFSPQNHLNLHAECEFDNTGALSPQLSGNARFSGDLAGAMTNLNARLTLKSASLNIAGNTLKDAEAELSIPHADVPRIMEELPRLTSDLRRELSDKPSGDTPSQVTPVSVSALHAESKKNSPLLTGLARASLKINGQSAGLDTRWSAEERTAEKGRTLHVNLDKLDVHIEDSSLKGHITADFPFEASPATAGTVAALLGMTPPNLDGVLNIRVPRWAPLTRLSGLQLSGSPLSADLNFSSLKHQNLQWKSRLDHFRIQTSQGELSLAGFKNDIDIKDMWGLPNIKVNAGLTRLTTPTLALSRVKVDLGGNRNGVQGSLQSYGDIRCDTLVRWKPDVCTLDRLDLEIRPTMLGLSGDEPAGIRLDAPAYVRRKGDRFFLSGASLTALPSGRLSLAGSWGPKQLDVSADVSRLELKRFRSFFQDIPEGEVNCHAEVSGTMERPSGNLKLYLKDIRLPGSTLPPVSADVTGRLGVSGKRRQLSLDLKLPDDSRTALGLSECAVQMSLPFTSPVKGMSMPDARGPLYGDIRLAGELGQIWKLMPLADQRLSGQINLTSRLSGTMAAPDLTLHASVDNGRFADLLQGVELRDIRLRADADRLNIIRRSGSPLTLSFSAGDGRKGTVNMDGWFDPSDLQLSISGKMNRLSPLRRQDVNIMLSGEFSADGSATAPRVRADITVDKGQIQLADLPGSDIVTLPIEKPGQKSTSQVKAPGGSMNVHVRIPNQFFIRGYGLECEWKGDIQARGPFAKPAVTGNVQAVRGGLDLLGKHFNLAEGRISFDGGWPISPMLNIVMEYTASSLTADVTVSGPATKPEISLSSQPTMPQDEVISQIMFGQSAGTLSHVQAIQLAAGAAQLAGLGGPDVMGFSRELLGLDVVKLNSESTTSEDGNSDMSKTSLEMGTYVLDNVYVGVEQGIGRESETDAVVEIELTPSLDAQAKASSNRTEFGLEWKKNY